MWPLPEPAERGREMPAERRRSTADTDTALLPREHRGLVSPGVEKELEALDEAEELLAPTVHARDRQAGKRGKRSKADTQVWRGQFRRTNSKSCYGMSRGLEYNY